jgi:hypothetical protein
MGLPLSSYTLLKSFSSEGTKTIDKAVAIRAIKDFELYAFIVHDPELHRDFHTYLEKNIERLDNITGSRLLFFALVDPPSNWQPRLSEKIGFETSELLSPHNFLRSKDPGITASGIAHLLRIPYENLPCIVVTNNFRLKKLKYITTNSRDLFGHMQRLEELSWHLGELRSRSGHRSPEEVFENLDFSRYDIANNVRQTDLTMSFCDTVTSLLSLVEQGRSNNDEARIQAEHSLRNLLAQLKQNKISDVYDPDHFEKFDYLCERIIHFLAQYSGEQKRPTLNIDKDILEDQTYSLLRSALSVSGMLRGGDGNHGFDFTPSIVCYAKIFEIEANLSLVHWMRQQVGIQLPKYYNQWQPPKDSERFLVIPNLKKPHPVDLNQRKRNNKDTWQAPGIGQSKLAWDRLVAKGACPKGWSKEICEEIKTPWSVIAKLRNDAAHTELMVEQDEETMLEQIRTLVISNYFKRMKDLKVSLQRG